MTAQAKLRRIVWRWLAPLAGVTALAFAILFYFYSPQQRSYRLTFTAGNEQGMRHQLALRLGDEAARLSVALQVRPCVGSQEALDWVNSRKVDAALVQGGLTTEGRPNVRQVATLHIEPMLLLVRQDLFQEASSSLTALRGKRVDLEQVGSGTHALASAILNYVGLKPRDLDAKQGYVPMSLDRRQLLTEQDANALPDAVFLVSSLPSGIAKYLVTRHGYRLVPLPFAEAFALESLAGNVDEVPGAIQQHIQTGRIHATTIPPFACSAEPPVPAAPLPTLGTRLLLVAHKDVPARAVFQLVAATYAVEFGRIVRPALDAKLLELPPEFPWHSGTVLYQQRNTPLLSGQAMDSAQKGVAILAAAASGLFVLWQWAKKYGQFARDKGFNTYITQVARIEEQALQAEQDHQLDVSQFRDLRARLCRLKTQVLDEFAQGDLGGNDLLAGFLIQVNDIRDYLTRLVLEQESKPAEVVREAALVPPAP
jgi:TRAP-type uncharacterized transport system substrate-binding protein